MRKVRTCIFLVIIIIFSFSSVCFSKNADNMAENIYEETTEENSSEKKFVYLTFDDGPGGKVTEQILDTLKKEEVNGTFFVVGNLAETQHDLIKRMHEEGHVIGLHTYTHVACKIYKSNESFLDENLHTRQIIEDITGTKPSIVRFPFGCNNNQYRLNNNMVETLHSNGIKIYDWNVDSTDGLNPNMDPGRIAERAKSKKKNALLLMHCGFANKNSAKALPMIIKYYKSQGYEFKVIDENTPELYKVKKRR